MLKLKTLNSDAWAIVDEGKSVGILSVHPNELYNGVYRGKKFTFVNKAEVENFLEPNIFEREDRKMKLVKDREIFVKGFPTELADVFPIETPHELPIFTKTEKSDILYCAGYYCINYPMGWLKAFCPKLATAEKYGWVGPFKTKDELKVAIKQAKKKQKNGRRSQV